MKILKFELLMLALLFVFVGDWNIITGANRVWQALLTDGGCTAIVLMLLGILSAIFTVLLQDN